MNKYFKIIVAIGALASGFSSFAMLTRVKTDPLSRSFHKNNEIREHIGPSAEQCARMGISKQEAHFFKKQPLKLMADRFNTLLDDEKRKFHDPKKLQLMKKCPEVVYFSLFKANQVMIHICIDKPFEEVMLRYAHAKELKHRYPICWDEVEFTEQHYMVLTDKQASVLSHMSTKQLMYGEDDVDEFVDAFGKLQKIDSTIKCSKNITNAIKLHSSLSERAGYFWRTDHYYVDKNLIIGSSYVNLAIEVLWRTIGIGFCDKKKAILLQDFNACKDSLTRSLIFDEIKKLCSYRDSVFWTECFSFCASMSAICVLAKKKYDNYSYSLKNHALPNQTSLTDFLDERAEQAKKSKES